jgi:hypothetical protein
VVAGNQKHRDVRAGVIAKSLRQPFPEILTRGWIVEEVAGAQYRVDAIPAADVKNPRNDIHSRARELLLRLFGKGRKPPPKVPISRVEDLQHDVSGLGAVIRNAT